MSRVGTVFRVDDVALRAVAARISERKEELARRTVERFREEIVGYQSIDDSELADALDFSQRNIELLVAGLESAEPVPEEFLQTAREVAARRAHRGISLESLQHQGRLWGETLWQAVLAAASPRRPAEREAALQIASRL